MNHLTVGRVPSGALVQLGQQTTLGSMQTIDFSLYEADWTNARQLADAVNLSFGPRPPT